MAEFGGTTRGFQEEKNRPPPPPPPSLPPPPPSPPTPPPPPPPQQANIVILAIIFPTMIALLQLKYQGRDKSPFDTHSAEMFLVVASFLIYCFALNALLKISPDSNFYYTKMVQFSASFFGALTLASYLSLLFPSVSPIIYTFSILYSATDQLVYSTLLTQRLKRLYQKFANSTDTYTTSENQISI